MKKVDTLSLTDAEGCSIENLIKSLKEKGVTDLSKVTVKMEYVGCCADHGDGYCYCPPTWTDIRLEWEIK
jgi:hypothetical protein